MTVRNAKPLVWIGSSRRDLKSFPEAAHDRIGFALYLAQIVSRHRDSKSLVGIGSRVTEVITDVGGDTFRTIYTVQFRLAIYVLHVFHKKSKSGIAAPLAEINLVRSRLKAAEQHHRDMERAEKKR